MNSTARKISLALLAADVIALPVVFNLISYLRGLSPEGHFIFAPLLAPLLALLFAIYLIDGYSARTDLLSLDYTSQHAIALFTSMLVTLLMTYAIIPAGYELQSSRVVIALSYVVLVPMTLSYRRLAYQWVRRRRGTRSLVFLGDVASCTAFRQECVRVGAVQPVVYATVGAATHALTGQGEELTLRPFNAILDEINRGDIAVEAIVIRESNRELTPEISQRLVELYFRGVPTFTLELFHQVYWRKIPLYRLNQTWLFQEGFQIAREPVFERLKRATDIAFAVVGLILASPFIALAAVATLIETGRPVFFTQKRIGKNHVPFAIRKLRSMRVNQAGSMYTQRDDQRVTRVGRFLRATRIDEFPQLWNVLRGEMSLIGPRAEWDQLVVNYERDIPCYHFRHLVKPGITGWAQVNYPYGANLDDTLRKLEYDLYYIRHFSFLLDASIVLKTVHVMMFGKGR